jgi:very-short-patch-repair endonuclease
VKGLDNLRDNDLEMNGWRVLRLNTHHIREQLEEYCLPTVVENINRLGGAEEGQLAGQRFDLDSPGGYQQLLLDDL